MGSSEYRGRTFNVPFVTGIRILDVRVYYQGIPRFSETCLKCRETVESRPSNIFVQPAR